MMTAEIHNFGDYVAPATIPDEIKVLQNWVLWRLTQKPGQKKPSKIPYWVNGQMRSGEQGGEGDRAQLAGYPQAVAACVKGNFSGVGLAIVPGAGIVALDFDDCVTDGVITVPFIAALVMVTYCEYSPSGKGIRAFMRGNLASKKDTESLVFKVEVFGDTGFVTVTGNVCPECLVWGTQNTVCDVTPEVLALYRERFGEAGVTAHVEGMDENDRWLLSLRPNLGWAPEFSREVIMDIPAGCSRPVWVNCLMALHHETDGAKWALELAVEWSSQGENFASREDVEGRWRSFGKKSSSVLGGGWLLKYRAECLTKRKYSDVDKWKSQIRQAPDEFTLREQVATNIKFDGSLGELERESLAQVLLEKFKMLGVKYPIASCRKLITVDKRSISFDRDLPEWAHGWYFATDRDEWYCAGTSDWLSPQGFNARFNRFMPRDECGMVTINAHTMSLEQYRMSTVSGCRYVPWADKTFVHDGSDYVNTYRHSAVPLAAVTIGVEGRDAIDLVARHIKQVLCSDRQAEYEQLMSFLAHCVKYPGKKIRWVPLIKGIEGDGKTILCDMLGAVMGESNVRSISPTVISTDFTGWAEGCCVGFLEELRLTGHSRYDILNALKPYITNDRVEIHRKGKDPFDAPNTMNYIAATNHSDALPLNDTDRRWFVLFTQFASVSDLETFLEQFGGRHKYFADLREAIEGHIPALRRWLLDYPISEAFKPNGPPLLTDEKGTMAANSLSDEDQVLTEIIEAGGVGITPKALLSGYVTRAWGLLDTTQPTPQTQTLKHLLIKAGWSRYAKRVHWNGSANTLWTRGRIPKSWETVKAILNESLPVGQTADGSAVDLFAA